MAIKYEIGYVPTILIFEDGEEIEEMDDMLYFDFEELAELLKEIDPAEYDRPFWPRGSDDPYNYYNNC